VSLKAICGIKPSIENLSAIIAFCEFEKAEIVPIIETMRAIELVVELKEYV